MGEMKNFFSCRNTSAMFAPSKMSEDKDVKPTPQVKAARRSMRRMDGLLRLLSDRSLVRVQLPPHMAG